MSKPEQILFVFEGKSSEDDIVASLEQKFLGNRIAVKCVFDAEIYQLYKILKADDFAIDLITLLKERNSENAEILKDYDRTSFAYTYLFFDYDAHSTMADDNKLIELLKFFNNETENGKLFVSYPMVEAIRHYHDDDSFRKLVVKCKRTNCPNIKTCPETESCKKEPHYKEFVPTDSLPQMVNIHHYDSELWKKLIFLHLCKANELVTDIYSLPQNILEQEVIFDKQLSKHIQQPCPHVAVLSAFPLFILEYYGCNRTSERLKE